MTPGSLRFPNKHFVAKFLVSSIAFGLLMGAVFPFYTNLFVRFESGALFLGFAAGCLVAGLLVGLVSFFIAKVFILRVIDLLSLRIAKMSEYEGELTQNIPIHSSDAIGRLVLSFNHFQEKIRGMVGSLSTMTEKTQLMGLEIAANSTETSAASNQIARHMEHILGQTTLLTDEAKSVNSARQNISESVQVVSNNIDRQSAALAKLSALIEDSVREVKRISGETDRKTAAVKQTILLSSRAVEEMDRVVRKMNDIYTKVSEIGQMIAAIDDIAQQIDILGINAAIEASHSGQNGNGFSVVASEIRDLSELAGARSKSIIANVTTVVELVHEGVALSCTTEGNLKSFLEHIGRDIDGISDVSHNVGTLGTGAQKMLSAHNDLVETTVEVTNSVDHVENESRAIEDSMKTLLRTAFENKSAIDEISSAIEDIAAEVKSLNQISETNAENVRTLRFEMGKFKVTS